MNLLSSERMKGFRDWVSTQVLTRSLASSRPLSGSGTFLSANEESDDQGSSHTSSVTSSVTSDTSCSSDSIQDSQKQISFEDSSYLSYYSTDGKKKDPLAKVDALQIKFYRLLQRFGQSQDNLLAAKVLYRIHLATLIRAGESDLKRVNFRKDRAKAIAREHEAAGMPELDFSIKILVLGKTGVGKSATINSIFEQSKTETNAFRPSTNHIREVVGVVNGVKVTFIDTPGFLPPTTSNLRRNRKIMLSVKRFIRKSPPDIVLYFERFDLINMGYNDYPLLKLMTDIFGAAIWFNTILVMTHSSTVLEGLGGYSLSYESYTTQCSNLVQHYVHQAVSDSRLENPVLLVENHHSCKKNFMGESILPNGLVWKREFLLLCICTKVLNDVNILLKFRDSIELGQLSGIKLPSLPHLLSSFLRHRSVPSSIESQNDVDEALLVDIEEEEEEEDEYDQLPSIRVLTKSQFQRLTNSEKKAYLDELEYRETLYLKKQMKEEFRLRKEKKISPEATPDQDDKEAVQLPDMVVPPSFDSDCPVHRYRCVLTDERWVVQPVLDPQGWDHDVGFDGINLETASEIKRNVFASITGQLSKDKHNFHVQSECCAAYTDPSGPTCTVGLDVQSAGKDLMHTVRTGMKLRNLKNNVPECGFAVTSYGKKCFFGGKVEDSILVGKRLKFSMNAGRLGGARQLAYGGSFVATLRGKDYPVRNDHVSLTLTALSFNKEVVFGGGFQSEFRPSRGMRLSVNANLNSRKMGQICVKISSSEHMQIVLVAVFSIFKVILRIIAGGSRSKEALESG